MLDFTSNAPSTERNYTTKIADGELVIRIDLSKNKYPLTKSEKSLSIASSHGFDSLKGTTLQLSLNVTSVLPS